MFYLDLFDLKLHPHLIFLEHLKVPLVLWETWLSSKFTAVLEDILNGNSERSICYHRTM